MGIGQRKQVQIRPYTSTKGAAGQNVETDGTPVNVWAEVESPGGSRSYEHGQTKIGNTRDFIIGYRFDLFPGSSWRIMYDGKLWTVSSIEKVAERRFFYRLRAEAKGDV